MAGAEDNTTTPTTATTMTDQDGRHAMNRKRQLLANNDDEEQPPLKASALEPELDEEPRTEGPVNAEDLLNLVQQGNTTT